MVISYMITGLDAVAKMLQRSHIRQYELESGRVTLWRDHLGFRYPFSRYCSLFFLKSFCLLEYRICHLPQ